MNSCNYGVCSPFVYQLRMFQLFLLFGNFERKILKSGCLQIGKIRVVPRGYTETAAFVGSQEVMSQMKIAGYRMGPSISQAWMHG